ncbi:antitoxin [Desulfurococcaceae archaeon AG1]|nr:antitoxin [Desulfurococcaceae archaeon AG1]
MYEMTKKLVMLSLRIPENLVEEIDSLAKEHGICRSELIRKAIRLYIEKLEKRRDKITSNPPKIHERFVKLYI